MPKIAPSERPENRTHPKRQEKCPHTQLSLPITFGRYTAAKSYYIPFQCRAPHADPSRKLRRDTFLYSAYQLFTLPWHVQPGPIRTIYV